VTGREPIQEEVLQQQAILQQVNHLLDADPHNADLWAKKALAFEEAMIGTLPDRVRLERSLLWWQQCLPSTSWVHYYNYAVTLRQLNRHEEALGYAQHALSLGPGHPLPHELTVAMLIRLGRYAEAHRAFAEAADHGHSLDRRIIGATAASAPGESPAEMPEEMWVAEFADPELFTLQMEVRELTNLGLARAAEDLCAYFELVHGPVSVTRSSVTQSKLSREQEEPSEASEVTGAYPLLEIAASHLPCDFCLVVDQIFAEGKAPEYFPAGDVDDFDGQIRWLLSRLTDPEFSINDPMSGVRPLPSDVATIWHLATLNFVVAQRLGAPLLLARTATTLATFYGKLGRSELPFILCKVAAAAADRAGHADDAVSASCHCAEILIDDGRFGPALRLLRKALRHADKAAPLKRYQLYMTLAECHRNIAESPRAVEFYRKAAEIGDVGGDLQEQARMSADGEEMMTSVARVGVPSVKLADLPLIQYSFNTSQGTQVLMATSRHEFYDFLLQWCDNIYRTRQSLHERNTGVSFLEGYSEPFSELIRLAVQLEMPVNALTHLETQKCVVLNHRQRYLTRQRPPDVPDRLWTDLQRLIGTYRRIVESVGDSDTAEEPEAANELLADFSPLEVADAIGTRLWECSQYSAEGSRRIRQKLGFGRLPQAIECADPAGTVILEFGPGVCFLVRPEDTRTVQVVELPEAEPEETQRLTADLMEIVTCWNAYFSRTESAATPTESDSRFHRFLRRLDKIFYHPVADRLDALDVRRLCVIPHGGLHALPLNLLGRTSPGGALADRFTMSFAPSLATLDSLRGGRFRPRHCLVVSDPVGQCPPAICRNPRHDCLAMAGSAREGDRLARLATELGAHAVHLQGPEATHDRVAAELGRADIVHLATHGVFDSDSPENSGLLLALPHQATVDAARYVDHNCQTADARSRRSVGELLTLGQLWKSADMFGCRMVNLSACSAGMADWQARHDEFYGLPNGFIHAGAQSVISSLWPVHDEASELFNLVCYEALWAQGRTPIEAVTEATRRLRSAGDSRYAHPSFWAGYRITGFE
jgi:CHAT domain-containing protein/tetratricopeptide (TPR) repeat protein